MKALVFHGKEKISYENAPKPKIGTQEVLMKIKSVGICGTDLHIYKGGMKVPRNAIIGHEFSGIVAAVGKNVTNVRVGEHVVGEHVVTCDKCFYCLTGKPELCAKAEVIGLHRPGALAEYLAIPADLVYRFPKTISFDEAALIEPLSIAVYAVKEAGFLLNKRAAVVGQGPIGLLVDQILSAAGALVTGIDVRDNTLAFAKKKGWIRHVIDAKKDNVEKRVREITPDKYDIVYEVVGTEATAETSFEIARRNGSVYLLGVFSSPARINMMNIVKKELRVFGSWTCANTFPEAIELVAREKVDLKSLITHRFKAQDGAQAFIDASSYTENRIKTIINF